MGGGRGGSVRARDLAAWEVGGGEGIWWVRTAGVGDMRGADGGGEVAVESGVEAGRGADEGGSGCAHGCRSFRARKGDRGEGC